MRVGLTRSVAAEVEYACEERTERGDVSDEHAEGGFGVAPDEDLAQAVCRIA